MRTHVFRVDNEMLSLPRHTRRSNVYINMTTRSQLSNNNSLRYIAASLLGKYFMIDWNSFFFLTGDREYFSVMLKLVLIIDKAIEYGMFHR